jgi:hypothetical protein
VTTERQSASQRIRERSRSPRARSSSGVGRSPRRDVFSGRPTITWSTYSSFDQVIASPDPAEHIGAPEPGHRSRSRRR